MKRDLFRRYSGVVTGGLACFGLVWGLACSSDDSSGTGGGGSTSSSGATGGSTSSNGGGGAGGSMGGGGAAGGMGGAGGEAPDLAGEYNQVCLPESPECFGGWVCKAGTCDFCLDNSECPNDDCNLTTFRCEAHDLCTVPSDCPSNSFCDDGSCVFDHPAQGTCGVDVLYFAHDTSMLTPTYMARFTGALGCLIGEINGGSMLTLDVFADNIGSPTHNLPLSELRGNQLRDFLISQGANAAGVTVVGYGASQSTGIYEADRAADRRVELNWN